MKLTSIKLGIKPENTETKGRGLTFEKYQHQPKQIKRSLNFPFKNSIYLSDKQKGDRIDKGLTRPTFL